MAKILISRILFADGIIRKGSVSIISSGKIVGISSSTSSSYKDDNKILNFLDNTIVSGYIDIYTR